MNIHSSPGHFISIEGIEGAGKTTAMAFVMSFLQSQHIPFIRTREPGGTPLAETLRELCLHPTVKEPIQPMTELLLMFAARAQHLNEVILPALRTGKWVVCDRFIDATYAYQGGGREMNPRMLELLDNWVVANHNPDLTLLLDLPPDVGLMRIKNREGAMLDRIEQEQLAFFTRVRHAYLEREKADPKRIKKIDASLTLSEVQQAIEEQLTLFHRMQS